MPLITIDVLRGRTPEQIRSLLDAVHEAMVEAFDVPDSDRYQVLTQHDPGELVVQDTGLGFERTDDVVVLHFVSRSRPEAAKVRLYELLATRLLETCGIQPSDLVVSITENDAADWSFGGGRAQFLDGDL